MKIAVLDYNRGVVDILTMSDTSTEDEVQKYLSEQYGNIERTIEYLIVKGDHIGVNYV